MQKKVTLSLDEKTYQKFKKFCRDNAIMSSKRLELEMLEILKSETKNDIGGHSFISNIPFVALEEKIINIYDKEIKQYRDKIIEIYKENVNGSRNIKRLDRDTLNYLLNNKEIKKYFNVVNNTVEYYVYCVMFMNFFKKYIIKNLALNLQQKIDVFKQQGLIDEEKGRKLVKINI